MKEYQPSEEALKKIVAEISQARLPAFFERKNVVSGEEIARFHRHEQVNKFVLLQIFREWNAFASKLAHPYFDFSHEEVQSALQTFQNVLSRHILVEKLEFRALFEKAVYNTLRLLLQPETALVGFFFAGKENVSIASYDKYVRYFSDFDFAVSGISAYCKREGITTIERAVFVEKFRRIVQLYEQKHGRSAAAYRDELFLDLTGKRIADYGFDAPASKTLEPVAVPRSPERSGVEPPAFRPSDEGYASARAESAPFRPTEPVKRVADGFAKPSVREEKISLEAIPIHKQFQYVQKIFAGSNAKFKETIDAVGRCSSWEEALNFLQTRVLNLPGVVKDDKITEEFLQIVRRRFE
ncbi:MAG: hypothetical protein RMM53_03570 [Bacteroidia bacterium]|nr:hypothetical protein [Bacteroidia bacterium]MDW8333275.1 hypothetical protein [Bacteroidia bacterium]